MAEADGCHKRPGPPTAHSLRLVLLFSRLVRLCRVYGLLVQAGEDDLEMGCPPLFEFASQTDANLLEEAANEAVEQAQSSRYSFTSAVPEALAG